MAHTIVNQVHQCNGRPQPRKGFPIRDACSGWAGSAIGARGSQACIIKSATCWDDACVNVIVGLVILRALGAVSYIGRDLGRSSVFTKVRVTVGLKGK